MSNEQKLCNVKIFQLQSMSNAIRCINQRFAFKNSGQFLVLRAAVPGLDIQPELSEIDNPASKKAVAGCKTLQVI